MGRYTHALLLSCVPAEARERAYGKHREDVYREHEEHEKHKDHGEAAPMLTRDAAEKWVRGMKHADGSTGVHWTMEQTARVLADRGLRYDPLIWWTTMNMLWSDYCLVAEKHGVDTVDFYADLAAAFLDDPDANPHKLARYHSAIAK